MQIHSIHQRRKVVGRSKNFDQLVAELKTKVREKGAQSMEGGSSTGRSPSPEVSREAPHCRRPLASLPAFRYVSLVVKEACYESLCTSELRKHVSENSASEYY